MAFGLISTTALLSLGIPPAQASAAVHTAEVATTGASGLSHLYHRNIHRKLLLTLLMAGVLGGVLGAYVLSNIDGKAIRPFVSAYLLVIGVLILIKAAKLAPTDEDAKVGYAAPLGLVGGFLDAIGGGGWGPMVTSTLIGSGHAPRKVIGSVSAAEFFVTVAVATTFFIELGTSSCRAHRCADHRRRYGRSVRRIHRASRAAPRTHGCRGRAGQRSRAIPTRQIIRLDRGGTTVRARAGRRHPPTTTGFHLPNPKRGPAPPPARSSKSRGWFRALPGYRTRRW